MIHGFGDSTCADHALAGTSGSLQTLWMDLA
jgi:hypothetical protein